MRNQTWNQQGGLVEDIELTMVGGVVTATDHLTGTSRPANAEEIALLEGDEKITKVEQARGRAIAAIKDNKGTGPWGSILYDLAVGQGWIEAE